MIVRTPSSIDALTASGYQKRALSAYSTSQVGGLHAYLRTLRKGQGTGELAEAALANSVSTLGALLRVFGLARDSETVIVKLNIDILFLQAGQLEGSDCRVIRAFVNIEPVGMIVSARYTLQSECRTLTLE